MFCRVIRIFFVTCLLLCLTCVSCFAVSAKVSSRTKVYSSFSKSAKSVTVKSGTVVDVVESKNGWSKVKSGGHVGYIQTKYLKSTSSSSSSKKAKGYASKDTYVYKKASSSSSKVAISANTVVYVVGANGGYYKVTNSSGSKVGYMKKGDVSKTKVSRSNSSGSWKSKVVKMDWFKDGKNVLKKGSYGYIYDVKTGIYLRIKRMGGHNHADVEPATVADTAKLLRISGGKWSWNSHGVILKVGDKYVASAINCEPHGDQTIKNNNFDGQFCLHMTNSLTHGTTSVNENHQKSIEYAYNWAH